MNLSLSMVGSRSWGMVGSRSWSMVGSRSWSMVGSRSWSMVGSRSGSLVGLGVRVAWDPFIGDLCNIAIVMVSCILDVLRATIRKSN